jgi:signal transduction histidine kinase
LSSGYLMMWFSSGKPNARLGVSYDLHDGLLQSMAIATMNLDIVRTLIEKDPAAAQERVAETNRLLLDEQHELRSFIRELKSACPAPSREPSLVTRFTDLFQEIEKQWGLHVDFTMEGSDSNVPEALRQHVFYLLREMLLNAARHAGASSINVALSRKDHELRITAVDNGRGFPFRGHYDNSRLTDCKLGPANLKGRITSLGGTLSIESSEAGAKLEITLPCP